MLRISRPLANISLRLFMVSILSLLTLAACGSAATKEPSAGALMPQLADYTATDTTDIQDAITKLAGAASLGAGQPELTALVAGVSGFVSCYQSAGAIQGRTYVNKADVTKAGVVVIVNRNLATDPNLFLSCVVPKGMMRAASALQPCVKAYALDKANNQFYIGYAATNEETCNAFCSALEGCTQ
jgi:hypothetical protein